MKGITSRSFVVAFFGAILGLSAQSRADLMTYSASLTSAFGAGQTMTSVTDPANAFPFLFERSIFDSEIHADVDNLYDFSNINANPSFQIAILSQDHPSDNGSFAQSTGTINFSLDNTVNMNYSLMGEYDLIDGAGLIHLEVSLVDLTSGATVFSNLQESDLINPPQTLSFFLGQQGGDSNSLTGSLEGSLAAGDSYQLFYNYFISSPSNGQGYSGSASGFLNLGLTRGTVVPAPASSLMGGLGLITLGLMRRRVM